MAKNRELVTLTCDYPLEVLGGYVAEEIVKIVDLIQERRPHLRTPEGRECGVEFRNDVFEMRPDTMDCTCGAIDDPGHLTGCPVKIPNFMCGDLAIGWESRIGLGMSTNRREVNGHELRDAFERCRESIRDATR